MATQHDWEQRVAACWTWIRSNDIDPVSLVQAVDRLAAERAPDHPAGLYERASARDSAGMEAEAEPLYRAAISSGGLDARRRPQAIIQLASTLRNVGKLDESERLLRDELERCERSTDANALPDETRAFFALTLLAKGDLTGAAALALIALAPHLSRYSRSLHATWRKCSSAGSPPGWMLHANPSPW